MIAVAADDDGLLRQLQPIFDLAPHGLNQMMSPAGGSRRVSFVAPWVLRVVSRTQIPLQESGGGVDLNEPTLTGAVELFRVDRMVGREESSAAHCGECDSVG